MTFQDQVRTASTNIRRRKLRSALASLGVVVGSTTIVLMLSLATGVRQQINRQFASIGLDRLTVNSSGNRRGDFSPFGFASRHKIITPKDVAQWQATPGVVKVQPEVNLPGAVGLDLNWNGTNQSVRLSGGDMGPGMMFQEVPQAVAGSLDLPEAGGVVLSQGIVQGAGLSSNDFARVVGQMADAVLHTPRGETQSFRLRVAGISQDRPAVIRVSVNDRIAMKSWWFNSTNVLDSQGYDSAVIRATDVTTANKLSEQLRHEGFQVQSIEVFVQAANRVVTVVTLMFTLIASIALLVAAIGIANTMVMAVFERTREIGILKAMGASNREIRQMFMVEAGFIGLLGGVFGLLFGWLLGIALNQGILVYSHYRDLPAHGPFFVVSLPLAAVVVVFATFIGFIAGTLPAQRAARLNPLDALRHE
jgi:ABC-type antimicrobial peptide transport system permease subunit